jgi:hypothetical protein
MHEAKDAKVMMSMMEDISSVGLKGVEEFVLADEPTAKVKNLTPPVMTAQSSHCPQRVGIDTKLHPSKIHEAKDAKGMMSMMEDVSSVGLKGVEELSLADEPMAKVKNLTPPAMMAQSSHCPQRVDIDTKKEKSFSNWSPCLRK